MQIVLTVLALRLKVSFYFGDANFPFDKFLFMLSRKSPEGWVPISTIASFKRMQPMRSRLTDAEIAAAVEDATSGDADPLVEVDESKTKIRRKRELVPKKDAFARSAYVVSSQIVHLANLVTVVPDLYVYAY